MTGGDSISIWSPLRNEVFRALWIAGIVSNIGTWMQNVGGAWLMTLLTTSPVLVALMQSATSLPVFLVGLPAGALADIVDRRRLLLFTQGWMLVVAAILSAVSFSGLMTPWSLLGLTFALGLGSAMNMPAWQAITPEIVPREDLPSAVILSSVSFNIARAVGPALGGMLVATAGPAWVFLLNALSFVGVILVIYRWQRDTRPQPLPPERLMSAMRIGWRYVRYSPALVAVIVRAAAFVSFGSALWALAPLVARHDLGLTPAGYGVLLGCLGVGALLSAAVLPALRTRFSVNTMLGIGTLLFAAAPDSPSLRQVMLLWPMMILGGFAWIMVMSSLNVAALTSASSWVQARSIAIYMLVFQGGMALASAAWGGMSARLGNPVALCTAAAGLVLGLVVTQRWRVSAVAADLSSSAHWTDPAVVRAPEADQGPVLIVIEYLIDPEKAEAFVDAMQTVLLQRRRDGALRAGLWRDPADPRRFVETFVTESWVEHLRQHMRVTVADREAQDAANAFHVGDQPPIVSHFVAERIAARTHKPR